MDPFLGEIRIFPFNFAPQGWAFCNGQILPIAQSTALFSLLGTSYGGDGKSNFALPNFQGQAPISQGQGPGLTDYIPGETAGSIEVTLLTSELPAHNHQANAAGGVGNQLGPNGGVWAGTAQRPYCPPATAAPTVAMHPQAIGPAGGSLPHNNMPPYLTLNFCIALAGIFPPRS